VTENTTGRSSPPWRAALLAVGQLVLMGCIILGLFTCFVGWQAALRDVTLAELLPRIGQIEWAARTRQAERADIRRLTATPGSEEATLTATAAPTPSAPSTSGGEGGVDKGQAPAEAPTPTVGAAAASAPHSSAASRGLLASLPDRVATRLEIPSLGVDAPVVLISVRGGTWDISQLTQEVGHLQGTASPGDPSNVVLAGHITLEQGGYGPFKSLAQLKVGEKAIVHEGEEQYTYIIRSVDIVAPDNVEITYPTSEPILTLITCANWDRATQRYKERIVAVGHLAE
jgi:LPXTG-site transpeptidase (sortase) family protein